ncbi:Recombination protein recR [Bacteroidales bacterium CF]|jgi:recombination protein RecR|nr:Recombination protein recR [Bacteroidales bacterium CF]NCB97746.1 recombination protein RecR [Bacteroidia bacterium]
MYSRNYPSRLLQDAVDELSSLPGVGRKSALRFALHLLKQPVDNVERFGQSIIRLSKETKFCKNCSMISDNDICDICRDAKRDTTIICVVENVRDVISIENTMQYNGLYHVLGGIISPMDGVGPTDLTIDQLLKRAENEEIKEVLIVLSTTMEGETTSFYLYKLLSKFNIKISTIARGIGFGDELEYTDEITLGRSIQNRQPFVPIK